MEKKRKKWKALKTLKKESSFREIFVNRKDVLSGLTKQETLSEYFSVPIRDVLNWNNEKYVSSWKEVQEVRKSLRKEKIIAVVCRLMPKGTILIDKIGSWGKRRLSQNQWVYFSCVSLEMAHAVRDFLDKIAKGIIQSGEDITEIAENESEKEPILEALEPKPIVNA